MTGADAAGRRRTARGTVRSVGLNVAIPLLVYILLRPHVAGDTVALAAGAAIPAAVIAVTVARRRRVDPVGVLTLAGFVVGAIVSVLSGGSALAFKLREPAVTGVLGVACLVSAAAGRPLSGYARAIAGRTTGRGPGTHATDPASRRNATVMTTIIGTTLSAHAAAIVTLALSVPTATFLALSHPVGLPIFAAGLAALLWYRRRAAAAMPPRDPGPGTATRAADTPPARKPDPDEPDAHDAGAREPDPHGKARADL